MPVKTRRSALQRLRHEQLTIAELSVAVTWKPMKTMRLRVNAQDGGVAVSAPLRASRAQVRAFVETHAAWARARRDAVEAARGMGATLFSAEARIAVWGEPHPLIITRGAGRARVRAGDDGVHLRIAPDCDETGAQAVLEAWRRGQVHAAALALFRHWEPVLGVRMRRLSVRAMSTRWGSCTPRTGAIRLNTRLFEKPPQCLSYVVVHELAHLIEASHNARFWSVVARAMPDWRAASDALRDGRHA